MTTTTQRSDRTQRFFSMSHRSFMCATSFLFLGAGCVLSQAQSVPVSFANTLAGGGTVCSTGIPEFAVGKTGATYGDGCPASQSVINTPVAVTTDIYGNVFIADQGEDLIRVVYNGGTALADAIVAANVQTTAIQTTGVQKGSIYTLAGGVTSAPTESKFYCNQAATGTVGLDQDLVGCPGVETYIQPRGIATDADGNVFFGNVGGPSVVTVFYVGGAKAAALITLENPTVTSPVQGYTYNVAGDAVSQYSGDGTLATKASLNTPRGLFIDLNENVYFADYLNQVVRRVDSTSGLISTVAGHCSGTTPTSCTAGGTMTYTPGDGNLATSSAVNIYYPYGVVLDEYGNLFVAEGGNGGSDPGRVRVVYAGGTLPGIANPAVVGDIYTYAGGASGTTPAQLATFQDVYGVSLDPVGYLYVTDYRSGTTGSNHIWRVDPTNGNIAAIAGNGASALTAGAHCNGGSTGPTATDTRGDGCPATQAYLNTPQESAAFAPNGNFYIADRGNNVVRSFTFNNLFPATTVGATSTQPLAFLYPAGSVPATETLTTQGATSADYSDAGGDTCALNVTLAATTTCVDYVKFAPSAVGSRPGSITVTSATATIATQALVGTGLAAVLATDPGTSGTLGSGLMATDVTVDQNNNVYVSDSTSKNVLKGTTTLSPFAQLTDAPAQSSVDPFGNVFIADPGSNRVLEVITTAKGGGTANLGAGLSAPQGVAADQLGNLYVADTGNNRLLYISPVTGNQLAFPVSGFALKAPTNLATDAAGDLFLVDSGNNRVLEVPMGGTPMALMLPTGTVPTAISIDAAGDLYVTDTTTTSVLYMAAGSTTFSSIVTGLKTPVGIAVNTAGTVYVADSGATAVVTDTRSVSTTIFPTTNVQLTSLPLEIAVENIGSASGTLASPPFVETGSASAFPAVSTATTCAAGLILVPGGSCAQSFVFQPTTPGPQTAKAVFSTTTGQSLTANFTATATNLILTTLSLTLTNTGTVSYGQTATYTVVLTPNSNGSATPTGMISFLVDGKTVATKPVPSNPYTFPVSLSVGTHSIAVLYSGDSLYAASNASTSITVAKAPTTTTASYNQTASGTVLTAVVTPANMGASSMTGNVVFYVDGAAVATVPVGTGTATATVLVADGTHMYYAAYAGDANYQASQSTAQTLVVARTPTTISLTSAPTANNGVAGLLLTATVSSTGNGTPTGTVTFSNNGIVLGTVNLSTAMNGVVTFTTSTTTYANYTFTASYSGDGLFQPSTTTITQGPSFVVIPPPLGLTVLQNGQAISTTTSPVNPLVVNAIEGYTGTLTGSCTNLPVNAVCRFTPNPATLGSTGTVTVQLEVFVSVNPTVASFDPSSAAHRGETVLALLLLAPLAASFKRRRGFSVPLLLTLAFAVGLAALSGCGNKTPAASSVAFTTPTGVYTPSVVMTDANGHSNSAAFTLTVIPPVGQ
jgi:sugar lactone lactonase YvrE